MQEVVSYAIVAGVLKESAKSFVARIELIDAREYSIGGGLPTSDHQVLS